MEVIGTENLGSAPPFDTLTMAKYLRAHGYTKEQAEGQVELLKHVVESNLATKTNLANVEAALRKDIEELRVGLKTDLARVEATLRQDIEHLCQETKRDMKEMEYRMTIKLGAMMATIVGFFTVMDKVF